MINGRTTSAPMKIMKSDSRELAASMSVSEFGITYGNRLKTSPCANAANVAVVKAKGSQLSASLARGMALRTKNMRLVVPSVTKGMGAMAISCARSLTR